MKILAVIAHPRKNGLVRTAFDTIVREANEKGCSVDVLDLYERAAEIPYYEFTEEHIKNSGLNKYPFFHENKERFMSADRIIVAYPIWWYSVPGVMKNWLDIITNYAFSYNGTNRANPKHKIHKALIINTSDMSFLYKIIMTRNSGTEMMRQSFYFMGIKEIKTLEISTKNIWGKRKNSDQTKPLSKSIASLVTWLSC